MSGDHHITLTSFLLIFKGGSQGTAFSQLVNSLFLRRSRATSRSKDTLLLFLLLALRRLCPGCSQDGERMCLEFVLCFFLILFFSFLSPLILFAYVETEYCCVVKPGLKTKVLLPQSPESWT